MILGIIQARASSRRLPGKVLRPILGKPMLSWQIERALRATTIDRLMIATSSDESDDAVAAIGNAAAVPVHRGSLEDVLDRFYQAATRFSPDHIVRLTGDCPLIDPLLIDHVVRTHLRERADYTSNAIVPTYPDGLDVEVLTFQALKEAWSEATLPSQREHVTPFVAENPRRYKVHNVMGDSDLSQLRWTVDEIEDFALVSAVFEALVPFKPQFTTDDVLALLKEHPAWGRGNIHHTRNEGYQRSLEQDHGRHEETQ